VIGHDDSLARNSLAHTISTWNHSIWRKLDSCHDRFAAADTLVALGISTAFVVRHVDSGFWNLGMASAD
jgi:hypothetical protein